MNDCQNAEMRDQLPDLLNERLDGSARAVVMAHVDACADCRDELELLRVARGTLLKATPRLDLNFIVEALPKVTPRTRVAPISRRPVWADWRIAAAAVLLIAGGSSYSLLGRHGGIAMRDSLVVQVQEPVPETPAGKTQPAESVSTLPAPAQQTETVIADGTSETNESSGLGASHLGDLSEKQLKALLTEIDQLQPTPITEPVPVVIRVDTKGPTSSPEGL
jgi:anti-sigma factor RsiW